jgi:hypothetical protein
LEIDAEWSHALYVKEGLMFCSQCGIQTPEGSSFCQGCGTAIGSVPPFPNAPAPAKFDAEIKARSLDALEALKLLVKDPSGGIIKSFNMFDATGAKVVGAIFGLAYSLAVTIAALVLFSSITGSFGGSFGLGFPLGMGGSSFGMVVKFFVISLAQFAALCLSCLIARTMFKGTGNVASDIYIAGSCLLPTAACLLVGWLGYVSFYLVLAAFIFAVSYTILMLYAAWVHIVKVTEAKAALAVPVILIICGGITGIVLRILLD